MDNFIQYIDRRLAQLRAMIPIYNDQLSLEKWLASWMLNSDKMHRASAKSSNASFLLINIINIYLHLATTSGTLTVSHPFYIPDENIMPIFSPIAIDEQFNPCAYWQLGQPVGASVTFFRQIQYLPKINTEPHLDEALSGALLGCG